MAAKSASPGQNPPGRGLTIAMIGSDVALSTDCNTPGDGVKPSSASAAVNSIRSAPASSAASASSAEVRQTSRILRDIGWRSSARLNPDSRARTQLPTSGNSGIRSAVYLF
jgi:hypothetical protein